MTASALYAGTVMHHRLRPKRHRLRYSLFTLLLDLDEIDGLHKRLRLFSRNRFNLFGFYDSDYAAGSAKPLREQVESYLAAAGIEGGGPIRLLAMPRLFGYAFNPISVYFCHRTDGSLSAILYEVNNTFGQRHSYLIPVPKDAPLPIRQHADKTFYVSPFIEMDMGYEFRVLPPGERLAISIAVRDKAGTLLTAAMTADRHELTDGALLRAAALYPLLTIKVIAGIHWEALKLWLKGVRLVSRPAPPTHPVTFVEN